jgi:hypothetical protein
LQIAGFGYCVCRVGVVSLFSIRFRVMGRLTEICSIASGILLTALEACCDPFATPEVLHIPRKITCRVSSFGDEIFDRSRGTSIHDDESVAEDIRRLSAMEQVVPRTLVPVRPPRLPRQAIPGEFPQERKVASPVVVVSKTKGWGEEWTHLVQDTGLNSIARATSSGEISQSSSMETSVSSESSNASFSKRTPRPHTVTPSSSISNLSRRSKLSTMR